MPQPQRHPERAPNPLPHAGNADERLAQADRVMKRETKQRAVTPEPRAAAGAVGGRRQKENR